MSEFHFNLSSESHNILLTPSDNHTDKFIALLLAAREDKEKCHQTVEIKTPSFLCHIVGLGLH